ncbi:MAG: acetoacetate decarboxylase [Actinobacteria bacterium]|nr:MAG: acetoacetate decarboxylase [Actinomycetota bacterium]
MSSLVPRFPLRMRNTEILTVAYRTEPDAIAQFLPPQLESLAPRVIVHLYRMHDAEWFGAYGESAVHLPVRHAASGTEGAYSPLLFVESDGAVAAGREIYGQPKKGGEIELGPVGDLLVGRLRRNGIDVVTATMPYKQQASSTDELDELGFRTNINVKEIHSVDGGVARQLTAREFDDVVVHEVWRGPGTVELRPNAQAPVHLLPVLEVETAFHWRVDFTLTYGRVLEELR